MFLSVGEMAVDATSKSGSAVFENVVLYRGRRRNSNNKGTRMPKKKVVFGQEQPVTKKDCHTPGTRASRNIFFPLSDWCKTGLRHQYGRK
jgi:hypothetical protein